MLQLCGDFAMAAQPALRPRLLVRISCTLPLSFDVAITFLYLVVTTVDCVVVQLQTFPLFGFL